AARRAPPATPGLAGAEPLARASVRELGARLLVEPSTAGRALYAATLELRAGPVSSLALRAHERRLEAEAELARGVVAPEPELAGAPPGAVATLCDELLAATEPWRELLLAESARACGPGWHGVLGAALGRDAGEGWPARLGTRFLGEVFGRSGWLAGRTFEWPRLPAPLGATSFVRAFADLGRALVDGAAQGARSFAFFDAPAGVRREVRAGLMAAVALERRFQERVLGRGRERARAQQRRLGVAVALALRIDLWRLGVGLALRRGGAAAARERYLELGERVLGQPPPVSLCTVLPRLEPDDAVAPRLAGPVHAAPRRRELRERFDEDWFRNPRLAELLHAEDQQAGDAAAAVSDLGGAARELVSELGALLD
ncbi:MAG: hypothetical protein HY908_27145, partial [Myxococcales bacterium]|nr:hypothetical protein [Myxococcales bacterium]